MGIQGLLPLLKSIMLPIHIKDLQGCCVAVDTYSWLHKGALSCSKDLCKGLPTSKHIVYCMHRVNLLRHYGVKPILVFDGGLLPMKSEQENKRARTRKENLTRAMEHESNGNLSAAYECYQKAVDVSPLMAYQLIQVLKEENISYVVAPYEADAQMTFLAVSKQVDAVITEDSDLIAFGCPRIIYKMDKLGQGVEFRYSKLQHNKDLSFTGFTNQMILEMCILSGCDYLQSLPGLGLRKAHALIKKFKTYDKVIKHLKYNTVAVSPLYEESFKQAIMTFQHQRVFDPVTEDIVHLTELSTYAGEDLDFLGPETSISQDVAKGIARGDLDPFTKMPFQGEHTGAELVLLSTNQLKKFKPESERKKLDLPAQKNLLTNYFCSTSIEARRNFRVPRVTPPQGSSRKETSSPWLDLTMEAKSCKVISLPIDLLDSEDLFVVNPPSDSGNSGIATGSSEFLRSPGHGQCETDVGADATGIQHGLLQNRIQKPCITLHKERASHLLDRQMTMEKGNVIERSSYFLHKYVKEIDQDNNNNLDEAPAGKGEHVIFDHGIKAASDGADCTVGVAHRNEIVWSSYFQQQSTKESGCSNESEKPLGKEGAAFTQKYMSEICTNRGKLKMSNRKVSVRSSYFQQNSINRSTQEDEALQGAAVDSCEATVPENIVSSGSNPIEGTTKRRKIASGNVDQTDDDNNNPSPAGASLHIQSDCISDMDLTTTEMKAEEGKFGCNISHLGHYSEVAEKSMEKFVSVISSFKFNSTGSRASGLRAPLKDISNTRDKRLSGNMELSKYAYVQTKQKASSVRKV